MAAHPLTDEQLRAALDAVAQHGSITVAADALGVNRLTLQGRVNAARQRLDGVVTRVVENPARVHFNIENGVALVFSDAHYYPGEPSTAHRALLQAIKEFRPRVIVANGDVFDGASISRHPRIGWDNKPTVKEELEAVELRLGEVEKAAAGYARLIWPLGNHDVRFETYLAANAPQFQGVSGFTLKDRFPLWTPCWRCEVNAGEDGHTVIKHRWKNGIHAAHNNTVNGGVSFVTGHLHSLKVTPFTDARGTRYGVDTGTLAEVSGPQFVDYLEDGVTNWRSGFALLAFRHGRLLPPETVQVTAPGMVAFRGKEYAV